MKGNQTTLLLAAVFGYLVMTRTTDIPTPTPAPTPSTQGSGSSGTSGGSSASNVLDTVSDVFAAAESAVDIITTVGQGFSDAWSADGAA